MTIKIKYDKNGNIKSIKAPLPDDGTTGRTRMNRAALELWKGNVNPTAWYKLRRFFKRLSVEISRRAALAADYHDEYFDDASLIGLEEHSGV